MNEFSQNSLPCSSDSNSFKRKPRNTGVKKTAIKCVFRIGSALILAVAIPAVMLFFIICLIIKAMDFLAERIAKR